MPWKAIARLWKHHAPRRCGWASPEFTVYEVSQAAGGQAQRNHGGDEVSDLEQGFAVLAGKQQQDHDNADKTAMKRHTALPQEKNLQWIGQVIAQLVEQYIAHPATDHDPNDQKNNDKGKSEYIR